MDVASIVLDLGFGDAGKGKTVDWLCSNPPPFLTPANLVVRFSGGQQAGHTVINENGKHVHSSFPSGTLRGVDGYITEHCTVSPYHMYNEYVVLCDKIGFDALPDTNFFAGQIMVHPLAHLTTPYEIAYNRATMNRGTTCGLGVGATMRRNLQTPHHLYVIDLTNDWVLNRKMTELRMYYGSLVQGKWGTAFAYSFWRYVDEVEEAFWKSVAWFRKHVLIDCIDYDLYGHVVFEGSQGILLDMDHGIFPHVTYANTTSKNIIGLIRESGTDCHTFYVTRSYATRHGDGPFVHNDVPIFLENTEEEINVENEWQGKFRIAPLDLQLLEYSWNCDTIYNPESNPHLCVTCMDQFNDICLDDFKFLFHNVYYSNTPRSEYKHEKEYE